MDSLAIQKTYRKIIARYIVNEREITADLNIGDTSVPISTARRFSAGDKIAITNETTGQYEIAQIDVVADTRTLNLTTSLINSWSASDSIVRKLLGASSGTEAFINGIYLGDPPVISHYPAITIDMKSRSSEWMTLESTKETYNIDITVYILASHYADQYELMHTYVDYIEQAFFRSFFPLVEPFFTAILANDISPEDTIFRVEEDTFTCATGGWIWFESLDYLRQNRVTRNLGNNVYETLRPIGASFTAGDTVVSPRRFIFNQLPERTQFGIANKGTMLKAGQISVMCQEEVLRGIPFRDPLTF